MASVAPESAVLVTLACARETRRLALPARLLLPPPLLHWGCLLCRRRRLVAGRDRAIDSAASARGKCGRENRRKKVKVEQAAWARLSVEERGKRGKRESEMERGGGKERASLEGEGSEESEGKREKDWEWRCESAMLYLKRESVHEMRAGCTDGRRRMLARVRAAVAPPGVRSFYSAPALHVAHIALIAASKGSRTCVRVHVQSEGESRGAASDEEIQRRGCRAGVSGARLACRCRRRAQQRRPSRLLSLLRHVHCVCACSLEQAAAFDDPIRSQGATCQAANAFTVVVVRS